MATRNFVPRADGEGSLGTSAKKWGDVQAVKATIANVTGKATEAGTADTARACTGNAATASALATPRTIALSGDATGSATFDGSGNATIATTLARTVGLTDLCPDGAAAHNCFYRGKDLTAAFNAGTVSANIANGTFNDIFIGDYITVTMTVDGTSIGTVKWIVAGCDYLYLSGDSHCTTHHVIMVPQDVLDVNTRMCASNDTTGGYIASEMWTTTLPKYTAAIQSAFGTAHVVKHRELLSNAISSTAASAAGAGWVGSSSSWGWYDVYANLMNEPMVYGGTVFSSSGFDVGNCKTQLPLFQHDHSATIVGYRNNRTAYKWYWLRAVVSSSRFAVAYSYGVPSYYGASARGASSGIRPYFLLR